MAMVMSLSAQVTPLIQMEHLNRGVVVLPSRYSIGNFVSWRFLGTDDENTTFDLIRDGKTIATDLKVTNFEDDDLDWDGTADSEYQVVTKVNGDIKETSKPVKSWNTLYKQLKLDRPATGALGGTYSPNDCSVGDVDGDGEYEIIVKWDPSNSKDNSQSDKTDNVFLDCYKLDGTKLWRIDLGKNIRAGAHYTQFQVYDYDGDGKAELMCKTAPGSKDGQGNYVNQAATADMIKAANNTKDWRTSAGRINGGHEYLTVFNGETGAAIHTIAYWPNRNAKAELSEAAGTYNWDDRSGKNDKGDYGNRGERYLAATAYLAGPDQRPSAIFCRGYYTYAYIWAVDFDGQELKTRWLHSSDTKTTYKVRNAEGQTTTYTGPTCLSGLGRRTMYANGNHNMSIADVDSDGKDEIIWGSAALDDDGKMLYAVGYGHGDAIHLADLDPDRPGLELFDVH
jgi:rhamnogalacturonan endolyase